MTNTFSRRDMMLGAATLAAVAVVPATAARATKPIDKNYPFQVPGFYRFRVGDVLATVIADGSLPQDDLAGTFAAGAPAEEVLQALKAKFLNNKGTNLHCNALLIETGKDVILFDCGGAVAPIAGQLVKNLKAAAWSPGQVTKLMISHAHPDHIFGAVDEAGASVFKNATIMISEPEYAFWSDPASTLTTSLMPPEMQKWMFENIRAKLDVLKPQIQTFKPGADLGGGISALDLAGHTPGHSGFAITSGAETLVHFADAAHLYATALPHPEWKVVFDADPEAAIATRKKIFDQLATDKTRAFGYHFPYPGLGHVARSGNAYAWEAELWQW